MSGAQLRQFRCHSLDRVGVDGKGDLRHLAEEGLCVHGKLLIKRLCARPRLCPRAEGSSVSNPIDREKCSATCSQRKSSSGVAWRSTNHSHVPMPSWGLRCTRLLHSTAGSPVLPGSRSLLSANASASHPRGGKGRSHCNNAVTA